MDSVSIPNQHYHTPSVSVKHPQRRVRVRIAAFGGADPRIYACGLARCTAKAVGVARGPGIDPRVGPGIDPGIDREIDPEIDPAPC
jgi:hypothetical protein